MTAVTETALYLRGTETLLASWEEYARGVSDAALQRHPGVAAAVFPRAPERNVYNNALLERNLTATERADALDAMEAAYAAAGVTRFAAWVHESERALRADLERRGYILDTSTRALGMPLDGIRLPGRRSSSVRQAGTTTCAPSACQRVSLPAQITPPFTSWSRASTARTSRLRWRSITTVTAASTTSERWSTLGSEVWLQP